MTEIVKPKSLLEKPAPFTRFLWWLATAEEEMLTGAIIDGNRYSIVGMSVLTTWVFATVAWSYFFSTVTESLWLSILIGFVMGFIILTIDRALIKSINRKSKNKFIPISFRILLATSIGMFMAQPALLYLFKKEIKLQLATDNTNRLIANRQQTDSLFQFEKVGLISERDKLQQEAASRYNAVQFARENFIKESDGSGGTGKVGIKEIALAKRKEYQKLDTNYQQFMQLQQPKIDSLEKNLKTIALKAQQQENAFTLYFNDGFLTQIEALQNLISLHPALQYRYYLLMAILLLIELMPLISKLLLPAGTYDEKVILREKMEIELANEQIVKQKELQEQYNNLILQHDMDTLREFINAIKDTKLEKIQTINQAWKENDSIKFVTILQKIKQEILINKNI